MPDREKVVEALRIYTGGCKGMGAVICRNAMD